ncbi:hypothetical protein, partial [Mesorhizobium sp. M7A.F.Ca.MR.148.00.0.0]|uniref:hypothetical protein n=1 Tax=Mesorhizobium sp. M7A.F.Ca.MR.148.00.0.0 TaxID=2496775 RepID=UPI0019D238BC
PLERLTAGVLGHGEAGACEYREKADDDFFHGKGPTHSGLLYTHQYNHRDINATLARKIQWELGTFPITDC